MEREQKLLYFRHFFTGRDDVFAIRQHNGGYSFKREPLTDTMIIGHMQGRHLIGSYPLKHDGSTQWAAADFDSKNGNALEHARILVEALREFDIEPLCNTSQSGRGIHVRLVFPDFRLRNINGVSGNVITASVARRFLLAMVEYAELPHLTKGGAFDRVFPTQDFLRGENAVGNQIAMPLNKFAADDREGTMLLDRDLKKIPLGDATWDRIELYDFISSGAIFDAVQSIGKYSFVYGNINEHGKIIYERKINKGTIGAKNNKDRGENNPTHADLKFVLENCNFMRSVLSGTLPYSIWVALASVLAIFDSVGGREEFHRISSFDGSVNSRGKSRYDADKTEEKYDNILSTYRSPNTCEYIAAEGWKCPHLGGDGICLKFRFRDGRGARTPATSYMFRHRERGDGARATA